MAIDTTNLVKFKKGLLSGYTSLATKDSNTIYITTDEGGVYLGNKRLGDYVIVDSISALPGASAVSTQALYYATAENVLARSDGSKWIQINAAGLVSVDNTASGNVVTGLEVQTNDKGERILKAIKGTMATSSEFTALSQKVTDLESAYKNADTTVHDTLLGSESDAAGANTIYGANKAAAAASAAASTADGKAVAAQNTADQAKGKADANAQKITELDAAYKAADTTLEKKLAAGTDGNSSFATGTYKNINALSTAVVANETALNSQDERITTNAGDITTLKSDMTKAKGDITNLQASVNNLDGLMTGDGEGSVNKRLANLKKEILTGDSNQTISETYDTLLEISNWITTHGQDATDLTSRVATVEGKANANATAITNLQNKDTEIEQDISNLDAAYKAADAALKKELLGTTDGTTTGLTYTSVKALSDKLASVDNTVTDHGGKITAIQGQIEDLQSADTAIRGEFATADTQVKKDIWGSDSNSTYAYKTIKALSEQVATNVSTIGDHTTAISTANSNITTMQGQITDIIAQLTWGSF